MKEKLNETSRLLWMMENDPEGLKKELGNSKSIKDIRERVKKTGIELDKAIENFKKKYV